MLVVIDARYYSVVALLHHGAGGWLQADWSGGRCSRLPHDLVPPSLKLALGSVYQKHPCFGKFGEAAITLGIWEHGETCQVLGPRTPTVIPGCRGFPCHRPEAEPGKLLFLWWLFFKSWPFGALSPDLPFYTEET